MNWSLNEWRNQAIHLLLGVTFAHLSASVLGLLTRCISFVSCVHAVFVVLLCAICIEGTQITKEGVKDIPDRIRDILFYIIGGFTVFISYYFL